MPRTRSSTRRVLTTLLRGLSAVAMLGAAACDDGAQGGRGRGGGLPAGKADCQGEACTEEGGGPLTEAFCFTEVEGVGTVDTETEYLANVIYCENGGADIEALKAMAIAARSVAYWEMAVNGSICDSQSCQVFSCEGEPSEIHYRAVEETSGLYLWWGDQVTYGFYVKGDAPIPGAGCTNPDGEEWVTYNAGARDLDVMQTDLGWVSDPSEPIYGQNRGCMSQLGMQCLEDELDYDYLDILRFYYGDDIGLTQAQGECVLPLFGGDEPQPDPQPEETGGPWDSSTGGDEDPDASTTGGVDTAPDPDTDGADTDGPDGQPRPKPGSGDSDSSGGETGEPSEPGTTGGTEPEAETDGPRGGTDGGDTDGGDTYAEGETGTPDEPEDPHDPGDGDPSGGGDDGGYPVPDSGDDDGRHTPGNGTNPWGDDGDTDTDGDPRLSTGESGCSVGAGEGRGTGSALMTLLGLALFRLERRRRR